jgi:hypothetical protein
MTRGVCIGGDDLKPLLRSMLYLITSVNIPIAQLLERMSFDTTIMVLEYPSCLRRISIYHAAMYNIMTAFEAKLQ